MPSSRPSSTQLKPQPQRKTTAATRPRNGTMTAKRLATRTPREIGSRTSSEGAVSTAGLQTDFGIDAIIPVVSEQERGQCSGRSGNACR